MSKSNTGNIKNICNKCHIETNHSIKAEFTHHDLEIVDDETGFFVDWDDKWEILQCLGCNTISVKNTYDFSEYDELDIKHYPPISSRRKPKWIESIEDTILQNLFKELYIAKEADLRFLTITACRTIIDHIMTQRVGDKGGFQGKLRALVSEGHISKSEADLIKTAIDAGNASAHRGWTPQQAFMVDTVIGIVENLSERLFILTNQADTLKPHIPPRVKP